MYATGAMKRAPDRGGRSLARNRVAARGHREQTSCTPAWPRCGADRERRAEAVLTPIATGTTGDNRRSHRAGATTTRTNSDGVADAARVVVLCGPASVERRHRNRPAENLP